MPNYLAILLKIFLWSVKRRYQYQNADRCIQDIVSVSNHFPDLSYKFSFKEDLIFLQGNIPVSYRLVFFN